MQLINSFDKELKYKLYSNIRKVVHPSISKRNISNYKIVLNDKIVPIRVFYPEKISDLKNVIIYVHGISLVSGCGSNYSEICQKLAIKTKQLVIVIDYDENKYYLDILKDVSQCIMFVCDELIKEQIDFKNITLMGDSIGATIVLGVNKLSNYEFKKNILISPILSGNYFTDVNILKNDKVNLKLINSLKKYYTKSLKLKKDYNNELVFPLLGDGMINNNMLIITSGNDFLKSEAYTYSEHLKNTSLLEIPFVGHGFLKEMSLDVENMFFTGVLEFLTV